MRILQLITLALGVTSTASSAAITSTANGNWNNTATWTGGVVPGDGDTVTITHNVTVTADVTIGNSPLDTASSAPANYVVMLQRTNGSTSNGQLTINSGATFRVRGSVGVTGTNSSYAPIITLQPGSTWIFDNTAQPTAVYRNRGRWLRRSPTSTPPAQDGAQVST